MPIHYSIYSHTMLTNVIGVVDERLRVYGTSNLRVVDARYVFCLAILAGTAQTSYLASSRF